MPTASSGCGVHQLWRKRWERTTSVLCPLLPGSRKNNPGQGSPERQEAQQSNEAIASIIESSQGAPLAPGLLERLLLEYGHDFSDARIHNGGEAHKAAEHLHANAFADDWHQGIARCREAVERRLTRCIAHGDSAGEAESRADLRKLDRFEAQVNTDMVAELGLDQKVDQLAAVRGTISGLQDDLGLLIDGAELGDLEDPTEYLRKLGVDQVWERVIKDDDLRKKLGGFKGNLGKAVDVLDKLETVRTLANSGDSVSVARGARHPALDGLAAGMSLVNEFNKVPVFGDLVGGYIDAINSISTAVAALKNMTRKKLLDLGTVTGQIHGNLD
ncbi:MAG: DUF4157 domain-containing protein [Proteobacteria bacterium]|jgi:hypothetical protein|nr:DUF4157 domain-containing protein [Pseudomonadota bacterium]